VLPDFDFHAELLRKFVQTGVQSGGMAIACKPRGLERHAELAASDLFFMRLNVGLCSNEKAVPRAITPFCRAPMAGDSGKLSHFWAVKDFEVFCAGKQLFSTAVVIINRQNLNNLNGFQLGKKSGGVSHRNDSRSV
jgi:hypothetical protein